MSDETKFRNPIVAAFLEDEDFMNELHSVVVDSTGPTDEDLDERITEALNDMDFTDTIVEVLQDSDEAHNYVNAIVTNNDMIGDLLERVDKLEETVKAQALLIEQQTTVLKQLVTSIGIPG